jgi:hypothetical protein
MNADLLIPLIVLLVGGCLVFFAMQKLVCSIDDLPDEISAHEAFLLEEIERAKALLGTKPKTYVL